MSELIEDCSIPKKYLADFLGYKVWTHPESKTGLDSEFVELIDVWREDTGEPELVTIMWCDFGDHLGRVVAGPHVYVQDVPFEKVRPVVIKSRFGPVDWWALRTNFRPLEIVERPVGFLPDQPERVIEPEPTAKSIPDPPAESLGDQFILPI